MSLAGIAKSNDQIVKERGYRAPSGRRIDLGAALDRCFEGTTLYEAHELQAMLRNAPSPSKSSVVIEVVEGKTGEVAIEVARETSAIPAALNFASAKNPGGGYKRGAKAQEEDLARCSALYYSQLKQRAYYETNRACGSLLYTDTIIYSAAVPFFRDEKYQLLEEPASIAIITAPAPNAGEELRRRPENDAEVHAALQQRAGMVLAVAEAKQHRNLVLGAWGCGVFRNAPARVAKVFDDWLESPRFRDSFERVVFAIYERGGTGPTFQAFQERLEVR
jgi:uncharacterized protein (TIGR02452 family)